MANIEVKSDNKGDIVIVIECDMMTEGNNSNADFHAALAEYKRRSNNNNAAR